jgi:hypothetical protein
MGTSPATPQPFMPVTAADFVDGFTITDITGASKPAPQDLYDCATVAAANRLIAHLNTLGLHPVLTMDYPMPGWSGQGPFQQEGPGGVTGAGAQVPYLDFTNSVTGAVDHENAGPILRDYMIFGTTALIDYDCTQRWFQGDN